MSVIQGAVFSENEPPKNVLWIKQENGTFVVKVYSSSGWKTCSISEEEIKNYINRYAITSNEIIKIIVLEEDVYNKLVESGEEIPENILFILI